MAPGDQTEMEGMPPRTFVHVGKAVEVTAGEARQLRECAIEMERLSDHQSPGWFLAYMRAHKLAHKTLHIILARSHAN